MGNLVSVFHFALGVDNCLMEKSIFFIHCFDYTLPSLDSRHPNLFPDSSHFCIMSRLLFGFNSLPLLGVQSAFSLLPSSTSRFQSMSFSSAICKSLFKAGEIAIAEYLRVLAPDTVLVDAKHFTNDVMDSFGPSNMPFLQTPSPRNPSCLFVSVEKLNNLRSESGIKTQKSYQN